MSLLSISDLTVQFNLPGQGLKTVLDEVSLDIKSRHRIGIIGASGSGKTQLAYAIMGLLDQNAQTKGVISYRNFDLLRIPERMHRQIRGNEIAIIFQDSATALNPHRRIGAQLIEGVRIHNKLSKPSAREKAMALLTSVRLNEPEFIMNSYPHELSGGMRQRVSIAMALTGSPKLIIADEPTMGLDVTVQHEILELLNDINHRHGTSILLISHDLEAVGPYCDELIVMFGGRIMEQGTPIEIYSKPTHPFTKMLVDAEPLYDELPQFAVVDAHGNEIEASRGCPFWAHCRHRIDVCAEVVPRLVQFGRKRACLREPRDLT